jgi:hypothetical protein
MTAYRGLYVKGTAATPSVGTTPLEARLVAAGQIAENAPGVPRAGVLFQSAVNLVTATTTTAPLSYNIAPCNVVISRVAGEGVYQMTLVGTTVANTIAAPASNSRWDLIYVMQNDVEKGDPDNNPVVGVVNGVAAAAPTKPYASVPAGGLVLAEAQIFAGTTTTAGGTNTLANVWNYTALRGHMILCRTQAERDLITSPVIGQRVLRLDRNNHEQTWNGTNWKWTSKPERYYADPTTFSTTQNQVGKLVGSVTTAPVRSYATQARASGRLTCICGALASGYVQIRVCVSIAQSSVGTAQGRSLLNFANPGNYYETRNAETDWCAVAANANVLARIWIDHVYGGVNEGATNNAQDNHLWVEVLPADD